MKNSVYCFQHQYSFYAANFSKIISLEMRNFRARLGIGSGQKQYFLWGYYELFVLYRKFIKEEEVAKEKVFPRNFFTFLDIPLAPGEKRLTAEKIIFTCDAKFNTGIVPLFIIFFPLLGVLDFLPFKINVGVRGNVFSVLGGADVQQGSRTGVFQKVDAEEDVKVVADRAKIAPRGIETTVGDTEAVTDKVEAAATRTGKVEAMAGAMPVAPGKAEAAIEKKEVMSETPKMDIYFPSESPLFLKMAGVERKEIPGDFFLKSIPPEEGLAYSPLAEKKKNGLMQKGEYLSPEKKGNARAVGLPPDYRYYKTYRLFYDYFFPEPPLKKSNDQGNDSTA